MTKRICKVTCIALDDFGKGICRLDSKTIFVDNLLPGEEGDVETIFKYGKLSETKLIKRYSDSKHRVKPLCKYYYKCGGCSLQHLAYEKQLEYKTQKVQNLLHKFGKIEIEVKPTLGCDTPWHFRNKVQVPIGKQQNKLVGGFYQEKTHVLVPNEECLIESKLAVEIRKKVLKVLNDFHVQAYFEDKGAGVLRHILIKVSEHYQQVMVVLVTATEQLVGAKNIVKEIVKQDKRIVTVVQNINTAHTNVILGNKTRVLYGSGYIKDKLCGLDFYISAKSFYQTNFKMTEVLYNKAIELADIKSTDKVLDAYCGTGTIGLAVAKHASSVVGIELEHSSILDANKNKVLNNIENIEFIEADCTEYLQHNCEPNSFDIVIMDPPRAGSTLEFVKAVERINPRKIIYVSCDPSTLARDITYFDNYKVELVQPVDMFSNSYHVETVVALSLKKN